VKSTTSISVVIVAALSNVFVAAAPATSEVANPLEPRDIIVSLPPAYSLTVLSLSLFSAERARSTGHIAMLEAHTISAMGRQVVVELQFVLVAAIGMSVTQTITDRPSVSRWTHVGGFWRKGWIQIGFSERLFIQSFLYHLKL
jgi:hypothetical protein